MSKYDPPAQFDPALFWVWVLRIIFHFIKAANQKRKKGYRASAHEAHSFGHDLFSFFLCGFYEKHTCKTASAYPLGTPLLSEESAVF
jgi:hypothetical protein